MRALPLWLAILFMISVCITSQHTIYSVCSSHASIPEAPAIMESLWFSSEMLLLFVPTHHFVGLFREHLMALLLVLSSSAKNHKEWERKLVALLQMSCCDLFTKCCWKSHRSSVVLPCLHFVCPSLNCFRILWGSREVAKKCCTGRRATISHVLANKCLALWHLSCCS